MFHRTTLKLNLSFLDVQVSNGLNHRTVREVSVPLLVDAAVLKYVVMYTVCSQNIL